MNDSEIHSLLEPERWSRDFFPLPSLAGAGLEQSPRGLGGTHESLGLEGADAVEDHGQAAGQEPPIPRRSCHGVGLPTACHSIGEQETWECREKGEINGISGGKKNKIPP